MDLPGLLARTLTESGGKRLGGLLHIASSFNLEAEVPKKALAEAFRLPEKDLPSISDALSPDAFLEFLWMRVLFASFGHAGAEFAKQQFENPSRTLKALWAGLARHGRARQALPLLRNALKDEDWGVRATAASALGSLFDHEQGDEPGRLRLFEVLLSSASRDETISLMGRKRPPLLMSTLALGPGFTPEDKAALATLIPNPGEPVPRPATELFLDLISRRSSAYEKAFRSESADTTALEDEAAGLLRKAAGDEDLSTAAAGLLSLGALGRKDDAFFLAGFLSHDNTGIREAAAQALGRMGPGAREAVEKALSSEPERTRILGCKAAARSWDAATLRSLARCLDDRSGAVRSAGVAAMASVEGVMSSEKKAFRPRLQELAASDPSPGLRAAAACAAANIP